MLPYVETWLPLLTIALIASILFGLASFTMSRGAKDLNVPNPLPPPASPRPTPGSSS
jgi:hypothetical protein